MYRDVPRPPPPPPPTGGTPWRPLPPPGTPPRRPLGRALWALTAVLVVAEFVFGGVYVYVAHPIPGSNCNDWYVYCPTGPSDFAPESVEKVSPGTIGCGATAGEVCFAASFESSLSGLTLGHLRFVVANASAAADTNGPLAPPLPLGGSARVTALASPNSSAGVWNMTARQWVSGANWPVPTLPSVTVVLDTGLDSNGTLTDAEFYIVLASPYEGSVGFPL